MFTAIVSLTVSSLSVVVSR